jgi:hypothetical protein
VFDLSLKALPHHVRFALRLSRDLPIRVPRLPHSRPKALHTRIARPTSSSEARSTLPSTCFPGSNGLTHSSVFLLALDPFIRRLCLRLWQPRNLFGAPAGDIAVALCPRAAGLKFPEESFMRLVFFSAPPWSDSRTTRVKPMAHGKAGRKTKTHRASRLKRTRIDMHKGRSRMR